MPVKWMAEPVVFTTTGMDNEFARTTRAAQTPDQDPVQSQDARRVHERGRGRGKRSGALTGKMALRRKLPHELTGRVPVYRVLIGDGSVCDSVNGGREYTVAQP